jgi:hypothetical protein
MGEQSTLPVVSRHGAHRLPSVEVDSYNVELKDNEGFIGDRASRGAFRTLIDQIRKSVRKGDDDPLGDEDTEELSKVELDNLLLKGEPEAAGVIHGAIEDFSQDFALIIQRFLKLGGRAAIRGYLGPLREISAVRRLIGGAMKTRTKDPDSFIDCAR